MKQVLTIAGSDSGGGAGIQADLKTFSALGVYGMSVITAVTAQNTEGVTAIENISSEVVTKQIDAIFSDFKVDAVKIGMVSNIGIIKAIAAGLKRWAIKEIILDPVMVSQSGSYLLKPEAREALINNLFPLALVVTPNLYEAEVILGREINTVEEMKEAARDIYQLGGAGVLVKGGHLNGEAVDVFYDGAEIYEFTAPRIDTRNTHGTGCTYSSAIAAYLARDNDLVTAIKKAKVYITGAIKNSLDIGHGPGPTHHFYRIWK